METVVIMNHQVEVMWQNDCLSRTFVIVVLVGEMNFLRYVFRPADILLLYGLFVTVSCWPTLCVGLLSLLPHQTQ